MTGKLSEEKTAPLHSRTSRRENTLCNLLKIDEILYRIIYSLELMIDEQDFWTHVPDCLSGWIIFEKEIHNNKYTTYKKKLLSNHSLAHCTIRLVIVDDVKTILNRGAEQ